MNFHRLQVDAGSPTGSLSAALQKPIGPDDQWLCEKCRTDREAAKLDHSQMIARGFDKTDDPTSTLTAALLVKRGMY